MKKRHTGQDAQTSEQISQADLAVAPITPLQLSEQCCPECGALLPRPLSRLDTIPGHEHLRRAITVALTGQHSITFLGSGTGLANALACGRITRSYGSLCDHETLRTTPGMPSHRHSASASTASQRQKCLFAKVGVTHEHGFREGHVSLTLPFSNRL